MKASLLIACTMSVLLVPAPARAQENWWSTAAKVLNSEAGQQAVGVFTRQATTPAAPAKSNAAKALPSSLSDTQISAGLRDALKIGTQTVVKQLGKEGGYSRDPQIKIPLPGPLAKADSMLKKIGMGGLTADLETRMNRAAEQAAPKAGALFINAIQKMTVTDAQAILTGPSDSATQYLRKTMGAELAREIQPLIQQSLAEAGAVRAYDAVTARYAQVPLASSLKVNMNDYVTNKAIDGMFYYVAREEAAIRAQPAKRTTEILKTVFGSILN